MHIKEACERFLTEISLDIKVFSMNSQRPHESKQTWSIFFSFLPKTFIIEAAFSEAVYGNIGGKIFTPRKGKRKQILD